MKQKKKFNRHAFTLIEVVVVIVILVAFALVIGLLDMGLRKGVELMLEGFRVLFQG